MIGIGIQGTSAHLPLTFQLFQFDGLSPVLLKLSNMTSYCSDELELPAGSRCCDRSRAIWCSRSLGGSSIVESVVTSGRSMGVII